MAEMVDIMDDNSQEKKPSYILIRFSDLGSVLMGIEFQNVTAGQMLAAAKIIELKGQAGFIQEENNRMQKEAEQSLAVPTQTILKASR